MVHRHTRPFILLVAIANVWAVLGCTTPAPVLYPNAHLEKAGEAQSKRDIAYCETLAREYVQNHSEVKAAAEYGVGGAAGGAALGAIGGAIGGDAGEGAAIGAAVGAAGGILAGLYKSNQPNPTYEDFVNHCLAKHGYEVVGWQ